MTCTQLPARYFEPWDHRFRRAISNKLAPGAHIIDIGGGKHPFLKQHDLPANSLYWGLDISQEELSNAPHGAYSGYTVADICEFQSTLLNAFDLAISWQVLEHVTDTYKALANTHNYLKPGGRLVTLFSGSYSLIALPNKIFPRSVSQHLLGRLHSRPSDSIFPATYDHCYYSALKSNLHYWEFVRIYSLYQGASYLSFSPMLRNLYLQYENHVMKSRRLNLATHYLLVADKHIGPVATNPHITYTDTNDIEIIASND